MSLETLAAVFTTIDPPDALAREAAVLARRRDAHLLGMAVTADPHAYPAFGTYMAAELMAEISRKQTRDAEAIREVFEAAVRAEDVRGEWRTLSSGAQTVAERILESGRGADMLVMARPEPDVPYRDDITEQVIRGLGHPVLMLPPGASLAELDGSAVIGWSQTREAARAAFDALLLLEPGAEVTLLNVGTRQNQAEGPMNDVAAGLARHGMSVTVTHRDPGAESAATVIRRVAEETGAAFIATGAFGHSRAYDFVIGAVTRALLADSTLPVMFSK
ncbi:universal stress protein [Roseivivax sediminis]|uniref:Universal stress protein family protein n=1 Tax=Roseivivax sediminis TaxID=936889 RepID=A0A1I2EDE8_9RHOB|nr:universal stress protein [Roseivivax sediminis]SFE91064.1 Universal stress protein family protein [Roseivivax sediminis]